MSLEELLIEIAKKHDADKARQEKLDKITPQFQTEEEALAYARRLAVLRPGDSVWVPDEELNKCVEGVFMNRESEFFYILYYAANRKKFVVAKCTPGTIVLDDPRR